MKSRIIQIGNSRVVLIPKALLEKTRMTDDFWIEARAGDLVIGAVRPRRDGWNESFRLMAQRGDDLLLDHAEPTPFDKEEWRW